MRDGTKPRRLRESTATAGGLSGDPELASVLGRAVSKRLLCKVCRAPITDEDQRIEVEKSHVHHKVNPAGIEFVLGCFDTAPGTLAVGRPTLEDTWFAGLSWSFSICRACGAHLGWLFEGAGSRFHGLILDRLEVDEESDDDD